MRTAPRAIEKAVQFQPETVSSFSQNRCPVWPEYARKLLKMTGGAFEEQPKITEEMLKTYSVEIENGRAWMGFENSKTRNK